MCFVCRQAQAAGRSLLSYLLLKVSKSMAMAFGNGILFKVWAKPICRPSSASLTALAMILALSMVTAIVLGFSSFHSYCLLELLSEVGTRVLFIHRACL